MTQLPNTTTEAGQREASVMLVRLCGWEYQHGIAFGGWFFEGERMSHSFEHSLNLYDPANMALAWRVLSFAIENFSIPNHHFALRAMVNDMAFFTMPIVAAQRAWLDKILTLAIEAGMIEAQP